MSDKETSQQIRDSARIINDAIEAFSKSGNLFNTELERQLSQIKLSE